ncbi:transcriptional regulator with XRE-family HTH domain [Nonomuraea thailandensis]|uniref:Transcriptional regulator with XRE-family HTH domain n=1 Tax=Nonomuraea thailandensis TaxID=1188745 RepID=A0A9X2K743_9ACTN|nr:helix-turn-helix transcriptional regulator [Nonomuraea thailandensis]MCP2362798.1 transcriptional regulator with XRE-family HTH domain [Nonomuraea thailandensis]
MAEARRTDLSAFLRSRRERITPEMVDLAPGPRRRTPGLRREEVAQLAGVGVTWYTWLEQGRRINASPQVLDAISRTLKLDSAERHHLYRLAGQAADPVPVDSGQVTPEMQGILDRLGDMPACVSNSRCDVLAWNGAYAALFPELVEAPDGERNSLWHTCLHPSPTTRLLHRDHELARAVAVFRGAYSRHADSPCWQDFVRRLSVESAEFARLWARQDVADPGPRVKAFKHRELGGLRFSTTSLTAMPEIRLIVYTPMDDKTRLAMSRLMSMRESAR